jgi:hypothetical protein
MLIIKREQGRVKYSYQPVEKPKSHETFRTPVLIPKVVSEKKQIRDFNNFYEEHYNDIQEICTTIHTFVKQMCLTEHEVMSYPEDITMDTVAFIYETRLK